MAGASITDALSSAKGFWSTVTDDIQALGSTVTTGIQTTQSIQQLLGQASQPAASAASGGALVPSPLQLTGTPTNPGPSFLTGTNGVILVLVLVVVVWFVMRRRG